MEQGIVKGKNERRRKTLPWLLMKKLRENQGTPRQPTRSSNGLVKNVVGKDIRQQTATQK
jgi:hypothetical protein